MRRALHRPWSDAEDAELLALVAKGRSMFGIAARLKRSNSAVNARLALLRARERRSGAKPADQPSEEKQ
jgi:hypothetical protein